jgi:hypothetical protein
MRGLIGIEWGEALQEYLPFQGNATGACSMADFGMELVAL